VADIKNVYRTPSNLTVTSLASIATSGTLVAGWISEVIDNSVQLDLDELLTGVIALGNSAVAGQIAVYAIAQLDNSNWPQSALANGTFGTAGAAAFKDATNRDSVAMPVWSTGTRADPGATDDTYQIAASSVRGAFGGFLPRRFILFVTHSTGVNLAASGHQLTIQGNYESVT